jgi:hypothetical protein
MTPSFLRLSRATAALDRRLLSSLGVLVLGALTFVACGDEADSPTLAEAAGNSSGAANSGASGSGATGSGASGSGATGSGASGSGASGSDTGSNGGALACPATAPLAGDPCDDAELRCAFTPPAPCGPTTFRCHNGSWQGPTTTCAPDPLPSFPDCPAEQPRDGDDCPYDTTYAASSCAYVVSNCAAPVEFLCTPKGWSSQADACPQCPASPPSGVCSVDQQGCFYEWTNGCSAFRCDHGSWGYGGPCDPVSQPPWCAQRPELGSACDASANRSICAYAMPNNCQETIICLDGIWKRKSTPCTE